MTRLQIRIERWLLPKVVQHIERVMFWLKPRLWIYLDLDQDREASLSNAMSELDFQLFVLRLDLWRGTVRYHTPQVSYLIADYLDRCPPNSPEMIQRIHDAIQREREERTGRSE
jgi:hypothetical protein